jgi:peptidyl-prolyl cis-trans isomerase D
MAKVADGQFSKVAVWVILLLLIVGLTGFGVQNFGGSVKSIGKVGDTEIDINRYARELDQEMRALRAQAGQNITFADAQAAGIDRVVLQRLIGTVAMENEAARIGISAGDGEVQRRVLSNPAFQNAAGQFDRSVYQFTLEQAGMSPATYEELLRTEVARNLLEGAVAGGVEAPDTYAEVIIDYLGEQRSFSWLRLDRSTVTAPLPEPDEAALKAFYEENTDAFMLPETRKITYVWLTPDALIDRIEVDDETLRAIYAERDAEFNVPERRVVDRLVFVSEEEAARAMEELASGATTFNDLVAARGLTLDDVSLGEVTAEDLSEAEAQAVFGADGPGLVGPVETDIGPALLRINAILYARSTPFEEVREQLRAEYAAERARRRVADQITELEDLLAGGATLEELAAETDLELGRIDWTEGSSEGIAAYAAFAEAARRAAPEDYPEILPLDDGGIFALRLDELVEAHPQPFEEARDKVVALWEAAELQKMLRAEAEALRERIAAGAPIGTLGYPVTVETGLTRDAFIEGAPPDLVANVFALEKVGESAIAEDAGAVVLAQLTEIRPADRESPEAQQVAAAVRDATVQSLSQDTLTMFIRAVQNRAGISINQAAINAVHAQFPQ